MKNKGFTLIELLAIIVILAIIAVITIPIILNIIEESKKGTITSSAHGYKDSLNKYYVERFKEDDNFIFNGRYEINADGTMTQADKIIELDINGKKPNNGYLNMEKNIVITGCIQYNEYSVNILNGKMEKARKGNC